MRHAASVLRLPYFNDLPAEAADMLAKASAVRTYQRGEVVILEGQTCSGLYAVLSGRVRVFKTSSSGREQTLYLAEPGATFNDVACFDGELNTASADALEPSEVVAIPKPVVLEAVRRHPELALRVIRILADRLRETTELVEDLSFRHVTGRVAKMLLQYTTGASDEGVRLTQQQMAALVGTAREVVGRSLKSLEREGAIRFRHGRLVIVDRRALEETI